MLSLFEIILMTSVVGYVYAEVLTSEGMVLHWWYKFLRKHLVKEVKINIKVPDELKGIKDDNTKVVVKESHLFKPMVGCYKCVAGQLAFWSYPIWEVGVKGGSYNIGYHLFVICGSILLSIFIYHLNERIKKD